MNILAKKFFRDEAAACRKLESVIWPHGPICTHCGSLNQAGRLNGDPRHRPLHRRPPRPRRSVKSRDEMSHRVAHLSAYLPLILFAAIVAIAGVLIYGGGG